MRLASYLGLAMALGLLGAISMFRVPVDSEALVFRGAEVDRRVGPGLHLRSPLLETVTTVPVLHEQRYGYDAAFDIQGCEAAVSILYRIGDLEAYHASGGDVTALADKRPDIEMLLDGLPDLSSLAQSDRPYADQISQQLMPLAGPAANGLYIQRIHVALADGCEPGRIVTETPLAPLAVRQADAFAPERATPGNLVATTADEVDILIDGFVATYRVDDAGLAETCFGRHENVVGTRIGHLAEVTLRDLVETLTVAQLSQLPDKLAEVPADTALHQCGLSLGAVDFTAATFSRPSVVNCEETPTDGCFPAPFVTPRLSVQD